MDRRDSASRHCAKHPVHRARILALRATDSSFEELCGDYDEVVDALRRSALDTGQLSARSEADLRRLRDALEAEISEFLTTHS